VVANGGEDEPGSVKDRFLLASHPRLVVEGVALAAYALEATDAFVYVNETYADALRIVRETIAEAEAAGLLPGLRMQVAEAPPVYVAGEETAALEALEGRAAQPRPRPPLPTVAGYRGRPTVVNNIETLANVPAIVARGPDWFRGVGTERAPGTMLFVLDGDIPAPGIYELPVGTPLRVLLVEHGGAAPDLSDVVAVQAGGASSPYLTPEQCRTLPLDPDVFAETVGPLGAGVMRVLGRGRCMLDEARALAAFFERESCGVCPPCRMETTSLRGLLEQVAAGRARPDVFDRIGQLFDFAADQGRCSFIRMPQPPFRSAFQSFHDDFAAHLAGRPCPAKGRTSG
jgi:NADH-quinone oxidoreductase subunit F